MSKDDLFCRRCEMAANEPPHESGECPACRAWKTPRLSYAGKILHGMELAHARAFAAEAMREAHCGQMCPFCDGFWTWTGWGEAWHAPGCSFNLV